MEIIESHNSGDGISYKYLQNVGGGHVIETGLFDLDEETICITTQIGCPMGCIFCASTEPVDSINPDLRFVRNLTADELVKEVKNVLDVSEIRKNNTVLLSYMGTGEPLLNYDEVVTSIRILAKEKRVKRATIATCGVRPDLIQRLGTEMLPIKTKIQLSLHAPNQKLRDQIMPNAGDLYAAVEATYQFAKKTGHKTKVNYVLIKDLNDSEGNARELAELLEPKKDCLSVKLMRLQEIKDLEGSSAARLKMFEKTLDSYGIHHNRYQSDGRDIASNCGQLRRYYLQNSRG